MIPQNAAQERRQQANHAKAILEEVEAKVHAFAKSAAKRFLASTHNLIRRSDFSYSFMWVLLRRMIIMLRALISEIVYIKRILPHNLVQNLILCPNMDIECF